MLKRSTVVTLLAVVVTASGCGGAAVSDAPDQAGPGATSSIATTEAPLAVDPAEQGAARAAILRLAEYQSPGTGPITAVFVRRGTTADFDKQTRNGGLDPGVVDAQGFIVSVDGEFIVPGPPGVTDTERLAHATMLVSPTGDELAVHVTNDPVDRTGYDAIPVSLVTGVTR